MPSRKAVAAAMVVGTAGAMVADMATAVAIARMAAVITVGTLAGLTLAERTSAADVMSHGHRPSAAAALRAARHSAPHLARSIRGAIPPGPILHAQWRAPCDTPLRCTAPPRALG